jgi:hypothetical protein
MIKRLLILLLNLTLFLPLILPLFFLFVFIVVPIVYIINGNDYIGKVCNKFLDLLGF